MSMGHLGFSLAFLTVATAGAMLAVAQPTSLSANPSSAPSPKQPSPAQPKAEEKEGDEEEVITLDKAPEAVRAAAIKLAGDAKSITKVIKEEHDEDVVTYEVEYKDGTTECAAVFSVAGELTELEKSTTEGKLPAAVMAALKRDYPGAALEKPTAVTKMHYEIQVVVDGKKHEVKVDASGHIEDGWADKHEERDERNSGSAAGADDGFRRTFAVEKSVLVASGVNTFFDLTPGTVQTFKEGKATLTITVLNETRVVDGVTTRVVEEREEEGGKPREISRNYFAIDTATSDVFYFGEDVDEFDADGKVSHPGVWHSGMNGARFGLMLPGSPKVGDKFYQELAPGVAMDRFEIVSMDETVQTAAGRFEHCVHVVETTPLGKDVGHKWYAPGTGLIKDGEAELASIKRGDR
ncbi:MAG: hypothetical protein WCK33_01750 [Phycisphaerae bacterium]